MKPIRHPSAIKVFQIAAARWLELQRQHRVACDRMWAGTIASSFTAVELDALADFLSPRDRALLAGTLQSQQSGGRKEGPMANDRKTKVQRPTTKKPK